MNDVEAEPMFVRSQSQLALNNPRATGQRLTRFQAEEYFGPELVRRALEDGVVALVSSYREPAATFKSKREQVGLDIAQVAKAAHLPVEVVQAAETAGEVVSIQQLNVLCQGLAIDDATLGFKKEAVGDLSLGIRLRQLSDQATTRNFSPATVSSLLEAAWIIAKQMSVSEFLDVTMHRLIDGSTAQRDGNYAWPVHERGFFLAERTRRLLGIDEHSPIDSVRALVEEKLDVPLIQLTLEKRFAGATIANGKYRGIVINELGHNGHPAVRRMTICHELCHLLWDRDEDLERVRVDEYEEIEDISRAKSPVESRANAFAVAFLAPPSAVKRIVLEAASQEDALEQICLTYGISVSAARHHIGNVCRQNVHARSGTQIDYDDWLAKENLTVDFLPGLGDKVPMSRRGKFAGIISKAYVREKISADTAAMCLSVTTEEVEQYAPTIARFWDSPSKLI